MPTPNRAIALPTTMGASDPLAGDKTRKLILAARELNQIGWGNQGNITGMVEEVDIDKLWPNPMRVIIHTNDEIQDMKESLQVEGQKDPIIVAYAKAPSDLEGYEDCTLLIVDGDLRYRGCIKQGKDKVLVRVQPFASMTQIMIDCAIRTLHRRVPTPLEVGQFILRIRISHDMEKEHNPNVPRFPTQEEFGRMFSRSQPTISNWLRIAAQPVQIVELVDAGEINTTQATELLAIPDEAQRIAAASALAKSNATGDIIPARVVRNEIVPAAIQERETNPPSMKSSTPKPKAPIQGSDGIVEIGGLSTRTLPVRSPGLVVLAALFHDTQEILADQIASMPKPHAALTKLQRALEDEAVQQFIDEALA